MGGHVFRLQRPVSVDTFAFLVVIGAKTFGREYSDATRRNLYALRSPGQFYEEEFRIA